MFKTLIVEDNAMFRRSLVELLRERFPAMWIEQAASGREALKRVVEFQPQVIFMDVNLPDENGLRLTRTIKSHYADIVIAVITNSDLPEYRRAAFQNGASHFFTKGSSSIAEILSLMDQLVTELWRRGIGRGGAQSGRPWRDTRKTG